MSYSEIFKLRAVSAYATGKGTQQQIADIFQVHVTSLGAWIKKKKQNKSLAPQKGDKGRPRKISDLGLESIRKWVETNPTITLSELAALYLKRYKIIVAASIMHRALKKLNLRHKKLSLNSVEKETESIQKKRSILFRVEKNLRRRSYFS